MIAFCECPLNLIAIALNRCAADLRRKQHDGFNLGAWTRAPFRALGDGSSTQLERESLACASALCRTISKHDRCKLAFSCALDCASDFRGKTRSRAKTRTSKPREIVSALERAPEQNIFAVIALSLSRYADAKRKSSAAAKGGTPMMVSFGSEGTELPRERT